MATLERHSPHVLERIRDRLRAEEGFDLSDVVVSYQGTSVRLNGSVDDAWGRERAERIACDQAGGLDVQNDIGIRAEWGEEAQAMKTEFNTAGSAPTSKKLSQIP